MAVDHENDILRPGALHPPHCFGCGAENPRALGVSVKVGARTASFSHTPESWAQGGFGVLHGGYLGAVLDEAMASAAGVWAEAFVVTSRLEVRFMRPLLVERELHGTISWDGELGRTLRLEAVVDDGNGDGRAAVRANATFHRISGRIFVDAATETGHTGAGENWGGDVGGYIDEQIRTVLPLVHDPTATDRSVVLELKLAEAPSRIWRFEISPTGVRPVDGDAAAPDAVLNGSFESWGRVVRQQTSVHDEIAAGAFAVDGDLVAAAHGLAALTKWGGDA